MTFLWGLGKAPVIRSGGQWLLFVIVQNAPDGIG
jgi:hypothetical protein